MKTRKFGSLLLLYFLPFWVAGQFYTVSTGTNFPSDPEYQKDGLWTNINSNNYWSFGSQHILFTESQSSHINPPEIYFTFNHWLKNGFTQLICNPCTLSVTSNESYIAVFTKKFRVTINRYPSYAGTTNPADEVWYNAGTNASLMATGNNGYEVDHWDINGNSFGNPANFQVNSPVTASAYFKVSTPGIMPESGTSFPPTFYVELSCSNSQATIYYTVDGSEPTTNSNVYSSQNKPLISGTSTITFRAKAFQTGVFPSSTITATYPYVPPMPKTLNLVLFLEGLYAGSNLMNPASDDSGPYWPTGIADVISVELHNSANYSSIEYSSSDIDLTTEGSATISIPGEMGGNYYLTVRHRNSIETTSLYPVSFSGTTINYTFTSQNQAYGNNLGIMSDDVAAIYSADVNQDDIVDGTDLSEIANDSDISATGYLLTDLNGDGLVDASDLSIVANNSYLGVSAIVP